MGFTHHYQFIKAPDKTQDGILAFHRAMRLAKERIEMAKNLILKKSAEDPDYNRKRTDAELRLRSWNGKGEPEWVDTPKESFIAFNGNEDTGDNHESFYLNSKEATYMFTKTARKGYDYAVCVVLLCLACFFKENFVFRSDGSRPTFTEDPDCDWSIAFEVMKDKIKPEDLVEDRRVGLQDTRGMFYLPH